MARKRNFKRLLVISDLHCGHRVGLTPPEWWYAGQYAKGRNHKIAVAQEELWKWYADRIDELKPIDIVVVNGDAIDGKGKRSGGSEQATSDMNVQCEMAASCIDYVKAKKVGIIYGTPYHTGTEDDYEYIVGQMIKTPASFISGQEFVEINGAIFDFKHQIGRSTIPHGRLTALKRAAMWNRIWNSRGGQQPKADFIIRSHVHYHDANPDKANGYTAIITPALQGFGSNYGVRLCEGTVDIGMVYFDIDEKGGTSWTPILAQLPQQTALVTTL